MKSLALSRSYKWHRVTLTAVHSQQTLCWDVWSKRLQLVQGALLEPSGGGQGMFLGLDVWSSLPPGPYLTPFSDIRAVDPGEHSCPPPLAFS